jgi:hypothetical protein
VSEPSLTYLTSSIFRTAVDGVRGNKIAAGLAVIAFAAATTFALTIEYDERPRYRQLILPDIERAEAKFFAMLEAAETAPNETWRLHYFLIAHREAKEVLKVAQQGRQPKTAPALKAHAELVRYYDLATEELAIIRTEMSIKDDLDYLGVWNAENERLKRIRENWLAWAKEPSPPGRGVGEGKQE